MAKFIGIRACTYSYVKDETYKNCLKPTQLENQINYLEKKQTNIDSLKKS